MQHDIKNALEAGFMLAYFSTRQFPQTVGDKAQTEKVCADTGAKRKAAKVIKNVWGTFPPEMQAVHSELEAAGKTHSRLTMPWMPSGERTKGTPGLLSMDRYTDYVAALAVHTSRIPVLMDEVERHYPRICADARHELGTMGGSIVYPPFSELRSRVGFSVVYDTIKVGADFERTSLPASIVAQLSEDHKNNANRAMGLAVKSAWECALPPLRNLVTLCLKDKTRIHDSLIGNLRQVVDSLGAFNITGDPKMDEVKQELALLCVRYPVEDLRTKPAVRKHAAQDAQQTLDRVEEALASLPW